MTVKRKLRNRNGLHRSNAVDLGSWSHGLITLDNDAVRPSNLGRNVIRSERLYPGIYPRQSPLCWSLAFLVTILSLPGCDQQGQAPARDELAQLLGELESDVKVLGSELQVHLADSDDSTSPNRAVQDKTTKLWVVRSKNALPAPRPQTESQARGMKPASAVQHSKEAFAARILYDVASALGIRETELPVPGTGQLASAKGRLTEWSKSPWSIRIRDFQAETGWLSVVEAIPE